MCDDVRSADDIHFSSVQHYQNVNKHLVLCHHCDLLVELPRLKFGQRAVCPRCETILSRRWRKPKAQPVGYAISALMMLFLAAVFPFINFRVSGNYHQIDLREIPMDLVTLDYPSLSLLFVFFVQLIPLISMLAIILLCLDVPLPRSIRRTMAKVIFLFKPWCMVEIFLAGVLVSFVKLISYGDIGVGLSFIAYCLFCLLQIKAFNTIDKRWLWHHFSRAPNIEKDLIVGLTGASQGVRLCQCCHAILPKDREKCPRCHTHGQLRRKNSLSWTMSLLITSVIFYIPANIVPIMETVALGTPYSSTILEGVITMWDDGSYPVALVIFIASILIPCLKIVAIGWLCYYASGKGMRESKRMHQMYEVVEFVGRWSMIDIFVIAVLSSLVQIGNLMGIFPDLGAIFFALVVILTMVSAAMFDPRLIWDRSPILINKDTQRGEEEL